MKRSSWRQFEEWVIGLKADRIWFVCLRLIGIYVLMIAAISLIGHFTNVYFHRYINQQITLLFQSTDAPLEPTVISDFFHQLTNNSVVLFLWIFSSAAIIGSAIIVLMFRPLKRILEGQRRFIADASHELRTPLSNIKTSSEVLLLDVDSVTKEEAVTTLRSNLEEIDRMSQILTNLLNLSAAVRNVYTVAFSSVNVAEVVKKTAQRLEDIADKKRIQLAVIGVDWAPVWGNSIALEEVVFNLMKNAILYTFRGGAVTALVKNDGVGFVKLVIRDTGIGIHPEDIDYIFEPFYRARKTHHFKDEGLGLGLTIVREIVKQHRGLIHIDSVPRGGTSVTIILPVKTA